MAFDHDIRSYSDMRVGESQVELVTAVYRAMPMAMLAVLIITSVIGVSLIDQVDRGDLLAWWLVSNLVIVIRWVGVLLFRRADPRLALV